MVFMSCAFLSLLFTVSASSLNHNEFIAINSKYNSVVLFLLCFIPIFFYGIYFVGFRPLDAGFDTSRYISTYLQLNDFFEAAFVGKNIYGNTEYLWWPLQSLFNPYFDPRSWILINYLLIVLVVSILYVKISRLYNLSSLIFIFVFCTFYLVYAGNAMRQAVALPLGALSFFLYFERKGLLASLVLLLAIGLHWSSLIFVFSPLIRSVVSIKDSRIFYLPVISLMLSPFIKVILGKAVEFFSIGSLSGKYHLYFEGVRVSHVGPVWLTFNFWLCAIFSLTFLFFCKASNYKSKSLHCYISFFISIIFFGINVSDFAERFFPAVLLVLPAFFAILIKRLIIKNEKLASVVYLSFFFLMGLLVFLNKSAQVTLGYSLEYGI